MLPVEKKTLINKVISIQNQMYYLWSFIVSPRTMGTLTPSSSWLCNTMLSQIDWSKSLEVAEFGSADGVLTRRILSRMRADAKLEAFEIQPLFVRKLTQIEDHRLEVKAHSAEHMRNHYNAVFSSLPLLSMPTRTSIRILRTTQKQLKEKDGVLILFQYSHFSEKLLSRYFTWHKVRVMKNFPPALVYICKPL
ncbi:MAG TPA: methyltransferase [Scandinavium sp.]|jgi:phospholipid N-methyltransferase